MKAEGETGLGLFETEGPAKASARRRCWGGDLSQVKEVTTWILGEEQSTHKE